MFIFLVYSLFYFAGETYPTKSNMKFAQLHNLLSQNVGGDKIYYVPPVLPKQLGPCTGL